MYEIALCDDDTEFLSTFKLRLSEILTRRAVPFRLHTFSDIASLQGAMEQGQKFSLLFLDIFFGGEKGICFGKALRSRNDSTDIIYMTTLPEYAAESYDVAPLHFLVKPVETQKLETAVSRFLEKHSAHTLHFLTPKGNLYIPLSDILFFEIYGHKIIIHLADGTQETCAGTLKELEHLLPAEVFVRPHRSYLVNLGHVSGIVRYHIRLSSGENIPVSKDLYNQIQSSFIVFASRQSLSL